MTATLLSMRDAAARRGAFELGPVSLEVRAGELVAVVGPNAAGKSTLLALAAGTLAAGSGEVSLMGDDPASLPRREVARRAAFVRQGSPPPMQLTAEELVLHGRFVHLEAWRFPGERDLAAARAALARCGADALAARDVATLSGGELQRVLIAKAVAQESPLLLLDEPTANLDLAHRVQALRLLRGLARDGHACVVVSHDLDLVGSGCDRVVVLARGRILADGAPEDVLREDVLVASHGAAVRVERDALTGRPRVVPRWE